MKLYGILAFCAIGFSFIGCLGSEESHDAFGPTDSCNTGGSVGSGGSGGNGEPAQCTTPKQIRLLEAVTQTGVEIEVRYDSLDRREPRVGIEKLPTTELQPGDLIEIDTPDKVYRETVLVTDVGILPDMITDQKRRSFRAIFTKPHILNAPGTTPIEEGCPAFVMPVQDVCDVHGKVFNLEGTCYNKICMYGEWVIDVKPDGTPCGTEVDGVYSGTCRIIGYTFGYCDPI